MKLQSFRVINCFGFRDSGEINLKDENNFIYLLGRNSSGKSSVLNAIKYFEVEEVPQEKPNFRNFIDTGEPSKLCAEFSIDDSDLSFDSFWKTFSKSFPQFDDSVINSDTDLDLLIETIKTHYQLLMDELRQDGFVRFEKYGNGRYQITQHPPYKQYNERRQAITDSIKNATNSNGHFRINGSWQEIPLSFWALEEIIFRQSPRIILFNEQYSLKEILPERITPQTLRGEKSKFLEAFISYLGEDDISQFLASNDPDEIEGLKKRLQQRLNGLIEQVNSHRQSKNKDLLEIRLHEKNGLQITVQTDGKKSYYSHISDNTKFLFAYYLYHAKESLSRDILLFDEPSNGFHPTAQEFILNFLKSLANNENLVIVATHSEHLIDLELLSGVRLMGADSNRSITVRNSIYNSRKETGDYLALQPILDAIGYSYGRQINVKDKVVITEGITDMLYLRAFNTILKHDGELNLAPSRGDSHILSLIPFFISQGISFKVLIDTSNIKEQIKKSYGIDDAFIWEVSIPADYIGKMNGSGIEDLFTKEDFEKLLLEMGETIDADFKHVSNSFYIRERRTKRLIAHRLYERAGNIDAGQFENGTIDNFRAALDFCKSDTWFSI